MPSPRNISLSGEQTVNAILDTLDQHKERLIAIVESEQTTPEDKYEALMRLASLTGILISAANGNEVEQGRSL
jgi:hypothetical protein